MSNAPMGSFETLRGASRHGLVAAINDPDHPFQLFDGSEKGEGCAIPDNRRLPQGRRPKPRANISIVMPARAE
ncbi:hypothetical protein GCM10007301_57420 [Azorhizobium oxalatiphilum]|uniref:Uncharacterized protein n=1 Tax=Azorhizobium oxalatiphilum TaxID=980631 RepID=A0A917CJ69_9HYPH|nr:hypothetical protein GCM10007301_57420 [Azorhizobium oxalatiphilum]